MAIAAALALALLADPQPAAPKADWIARPTPEAVAAAYPAGAKGNGKAVMSCRVTADGALEACAVVSEEPAGQGFGDAALKLAPAFRMRPAAPGETVGRVVETPVVWTVARKARPKPKGIQGARDIPDRPGMGDPKQ